MKLHERAPVISEWCIQCGMYTRHQNGSEYLATVTTFGTPVLCLITVCRNCHWITRTT